MSPLGNLPKNIMFCLVVDVLSESNNLNLRFFGDFRKFIHPLPLNV